jgi:quercetin dioxygenase-like cupin family protein
MSTPADAHSAFRKTGDDKEQDVTCEHAEQNAAVQSDPNDSPQLVLTSIADMGENTVAPGKRVPIPLISREGFGMRVMQFGEGVHIPIHKTGKRVIVQVAEGAIELTGGENVWTLQLGGIAYLPKGTDHSFRSLNGRARLIVTMID